MCCRFGWIVRGSGSGMEIEWLGIGDKNEELGYVRTGRWKSEVEKEGKERDRKGTQRTTERGKELVSTKMSRRQERWGQKTRRESRWRLRLATR
jgi:hypothetical protein